MGYRLSLSCMCGLLASGAFAGVNGFDFFKLIDRDQTGDGATLSTAFYRYNARIFSDTANDMLSGTLTYPSASTSAMAIIDPQQMAYGEGGFATESDLDARAGIGLYKLTVESGTASPWTGTLDVQSSVYSDQTPYLTGSQYSQLQGINAASGFNFQWNAWTSGAGPDLHQTYFYVYDQTANASVVDASGDASAYTSQSVGANTFIAGHSYLYLLYFSNRFTNSWTSTNGIGGLIGNDQVTAGTFVATPEPSSLMFMGLGAIALLRRRR